MGGESGSLADAVNASDSNCHQGVVPERAGGPERPFRRATKGSTVSARPVVTLWNTLHALSRSLGSLGSSVESPRDEY